jgi:ABC-type lipoprotein export system ATPase subunit
LAGQPKLILADEPTGQLDHHTGAEVIGALIEAANQLGAALIINTHDPVVADRLAQRWEMADGRLTIREGART